MPPPNTHGADRSDAPDFSTLIRGVARSFALSLLWLPQGMRTPVGLAYLLARASDTIADSMDAGARGPAGQTARRQALDQWWAAIRAAAKQPQGDVASVAHLANLIGAVPKASEQALMARLDALLFALSGLPAGDRQRIAGVCETIVSGQGLDLQRFDHGPGELHALQSEAEVEDYTWRVAGCVGHFWTECCEAHVPNWRDRALSWMNMSGGRFGKGLQRLNLLRDTAQDLAMGRCYWPSDALARLGLTPRFVAAAVGSCDANALLAMRPLMAHWVDQTRRDLSHGVAYAMAVRPWRLRWACALPALLGLRTLQAIELAGVLALCHPVKVSRPWVYGLMWRLSLGGLRPAALKRLALRLGAYPDVLEGEFENGTMKA